jgi:hypothetical protein
MDVQYDAAVGGMLTATGHHARAVDVGKLLGDSQPPSVSTNPPRLVTLVILAKSWTVFSSHAGSAMLAVAAAACLSQE